MIGDLAHLIPEQRAVYVAEERLDLAEQELIGAVHSDRRGRRSIARARYRAALLALDAAIARLHKAKCELAGRRHLHVASQSPTERTDHHD